MECRLCHIECHPGRPMQVVQTVSTEIGSDEESDVVSVRNFEAKYGRDHLFEVETDAFSLDDRRFFSRWYNETFIPHVEEYQQKAKRSGKVLLIIDNAPCHPSSELLYRKDSLFKVLFLPLSLVQPIYQTVIQSLKKRYRKEVLRKIVLLEADGRDLVSQLKSVSLYPRDFQHVCVKLHGQKSNINVPRSNRDVFLVTSWHAKLQIDNQ
ncbi:Jerky -like protein-like [Trichinella pseudospiralis]|uniref:Jerky-like protein-like n=1 Tax=Trichinella pseudospiralis TaxID=6337 RepID=A0A0V0YEV6_TRIPS|nr:Jerky -like protein-like [Trichinella pseudospiralis]